MAWFHRLFRRKDPIARSLRDLAEGRAELYGAVEALEVLHEPLHGEPCVAIEYRAWPPHPAGSLDGLFEASRFSARQSVDFVLSDGEAKVLVRMESGTDVLWFHEGLLSRFGVGLRAEVEIIAPGIDVGVVGMVSFRAGGGGSPLRREPYAAVVHGERIWLRANARPKR